MQAETPVEPPVRIQVQVQLAVGLLEPVSGAGLDPEGYDHNGNISSPPFLGVGLQCCHVVLSRESRKVTQQNQVEEVGLSLLQDPVQANLGRLVLLEIREGQACRGRVADAQARLVRILERL